MRLLGICLALIPLSFTATLVAADQNSLVIVFRDGHQQTFSMAEIARIEFKTPDTLAPVGRGTFLGKWRVGDGMGGHFYITLDSSGEAKKTMGVEHGQWTVVGNEARINWDDGWHDAIRKVGKKYEKVAFAPEKSFTDSPSNVTDAQNLEPQAN